uniref:Odorant receptor n=1 Tax=Lutzomyia longipalpis TaxID=7200 RepID=A0A3F2ZDG8_LUTLO
MGLQEHYVKLLTSMDNSVSMFGLQFLMKDKLWHFSARQVVGYVILSFYPFFIIYTVAMFSDDFVHIMYCLTTFAVFVSLGSRLYSFKFRWMKARELSDEFSVAFERMSKSPHIRRNFEEYLVFCEKFLQAVKWVLFGCGYSLLYSSIFIFLWTGEKLLPYEFYIPFFDHTTITGYLEIYAYQAIISKLSLDILVCSVQHFYCHIFLGIGHLKVLEQHFGDLNEVIVEESLQQDRQAIREILKKIVIEHQSHRKIMRSFNDFCSIQTLIGIICDMFTLIISIFLTMSTNWIQGIGIILGTCSDILASNFMGSLFVIGCESFEKIIYNCKWYCLSADLQTDLYIILHAAQHPVRPSIGGFMALELQTFLTCMKNVYTITMFLYNFVV